MIDVLVGFIEEVIPLTILLIVILVAYFGAVASFAYYRWFHDS